MTAINVFLEKKRAIVLTDGLLYSMETGLPLGFGDKCIPVADQPVVVATRGDIRMTNGFACAFPEVYRGMDDALDDDFCTLKQVYDMHAEAASVPYVNCDAMFIGWSKAMNRPAAVLIERREDWAKNFVVPEGDGYILPRLEGDELANFEDEMAGLGPIKYEDDFDPRTHGVALMEAQRRSKQAIVGSTMPPASLLGGHITLTEVTATGVKQSIIHRWPDAVGEELKLTPYQKKPSPSSELLDRAAAKRARKAAKLAKVAA